MGGIHEDEAWFLEDVDGVGAICHDADIVGRTDVVGTGRRVASARPPDKKEKMHRQGNSQDG